MRCHCEEARADEAIRLSNEIATVRRRSDLAMTILRISALVTCALAAYAQGILVRWDVLGIAEARQGNIPFTMESALAYHYGQLAADARLPGLDEAVGKPEGLKPWESFNLVAPVFWAKVYAVCSRILPALDLGFFYQRITAPVYCLGILAALGCAQILTGRLILSTLAALGFSILIPSVLRSTGQELMSENFALPLLWIHFLLWMMSLKSQARGDRKKFISWTALSALSLALAWMVWDMVQVYVAVWMFVWALVFWNIQDRKFMGLAASIFFYALLGAAVCDPYLRSHGAWASYPVALLAVLVIAKLGPFSKYLRARIWFVLFALALGAVAGQLQVAHDSYHHFASLFWNKLKFLNIKPADPSLLPYEVRALWVPALHSATWSRIWSYYGPALILWMIGNGLLVIRWVRGGLGAVEKSLTCLGLCFWFLAVLFVRMEVFWVFPAVLTLVVACPKRQMYRTAWVVALVLMLLLQTGALVAQAPALSRDVDYRALEGVVAWVRDNAEDAAPILASYSLSPSFAAYSRRPIVLQPKYETAIFRKKIRTFEQALMAQEEGVFYSLCKSWGVRYYVHSKGFYADRSVNSFRYLVGDFQPSSKTNLVKFELNPQYLNRFRLLYQNDKYLVYRVAKPKDLGKSHFCLAMASSNLAKGIPKRALKWCTRALNLFPGQDGARLLAVRAYSVMGDVLGARREATRLFERMQVHVVRQPSSR